MSWHCAISQRHFLSWHTPFKNAHSKMAILVLIVTFIWFSLGDRMTVYLLWIKLWVSPCLWHTNHDPIRLWLGNFYVGVVKLYEIHYFRVCVCVFSALLTHKSPSHCITRRGGRNNILLKKLKKTKNRKLKNRKKTGSHQ